MSIEMKRFLTVINFFVAAIRENSARNEMNGPQDLKEEIT